MMLFSVPELYEGKYYVNAAKYILANFDDIRYWEFCGLVENIDSYEHDVFVRVDVYDEQDYLNDSDKEKEIETIDGITFYRDAGIFDVYFKHEKYVVCLSSKLRYL